MSVIIFADIAIFIWIIFFNGHQYIIGLMDIFYPGITKAQVKFWAFIMLITAPIYYFFIPGGE